jgi:hypothetical protein
MILIQMIHGLSFHHIGSFLDPFPHGSIPSQTSNPSKTIDPKRAESRVHVDGKSCFAPFAMAHDARKRTDVDETSRVHRKPCRTKPTRPHRPAALALLVPRGIDRTPMAHMPTFWICRSHHDTMQSEVFPMQAKRYVNPRPANEFVLCLRCARWGSHSPDPDCSHVERVDLSGATSADVDEMVSLAERIAKRREEELAVLGLLGRRCKRLVSEGKARMQDISAPPSSGIVRLKPDPRDPRYEVSTPRPGERIRYRVRISTDPANQN